MQAALSCMRPPPLKWPPTAFFISKLCRPVILTAEVMHGRSAFRSQLPPRPEMDANPPLWQQTEKEAPRTPPLHTPPSVPPSPAIGPRRTTRSVYNQVFLQQNWTAC